jgi:hypothetical protein
MGVKIIRMLIGDVGIRPLRYFLNRKIIFSSAMG